MRVGIVGEESEGSLGVIYGGVLFEKCGWVLGMGWRIGWSFCGFM